MAHISRHELKQDQLRTTFEEFEEFAKQHYKEIVKNCGRIEKFWAILCHMEAILKRRTSIWR